jgi:hypothetical protein
MCTRTLLKLPIPPHRWILRQLQVVVVALSISIINRHREFLYHSHRSHLPTLLQVAHPRNWRSAVRKALATIVGEVWNKKTLRFIFRHLYLNIIGLVVNSFPDFLFLFPTFLCSYPGVNIQSLTVDRFHLHWTIRFVILAMWHPERGTTTLIILLPHLSDLMHCLYYFMFTTAVLVQ